jgi:hypothetical protein
MRTALEIVTQLNELLKRSKPFRNFNEVFNLTSELISTLSVTEETISPETIVKKTPVIETPPTKKKTTKKK